MPQAPSFPQELIDRILDEFGSKFPLDPELRRTLLCCALVSRSFRPRSQELLWTDIRITNRTPSAQSVLTKLTSTPSLFHHLRALRLGFNKEIRDVDGLQELLNLVKVHGVDLHHLGVCYDNEDALHSLSFPDGSPFLSSLSDFGASSTLTSLHLKYLSVPMTHLSKFINLKTLTMERCEFTHRHDPQAPTPPVLLPSLEELHVTRCLKPFREVFHNFGQVQLGQVKTLRSLSRERTDLQVVAGFIGFLKIENTLENLELEEETHFCEFHTPFRDMINLTWLKALRHLKLKSTMVNPFGRVNTSPVCSLLNSSMFQLPTTLETVKVVIDTPFWDDAPDKQLLDFLQNDQHWTSIDAGLADFKRHPSLYAVNLLLCLRIPDHGDKVLTLEAARQHLGPALQFPLLSNSPSIMFDVDIMLAPPLD